MFKLSHDEEEQMELIYVWGIFCYVLVIVEFMVVSGVLNAKKTHLTMNAVDEEAKPESCPIVRQATVKGAVPAAAMSVSGGALTEMPVLESPVSKLPEVQLSEAQLSAAQLSAVQLLLPKLPSPEPSSPELSSPEAA